MKYKFNYTLGIVALLIAIASMIDNERSELCFLYGGFIPLGWLIFKAIKEWET